MTGTLNPDATCNYDFYGTYDVQDYFRRRDGSYFIWWENVVGDWVISSTLGVKGAAWWIRNDPDPVGTYTNMGTATGIATVQNGEHP